MIVGTGRGLGKSIYCETIITTKTHFNYSSTLSDCVQDPREALIVALKREVSILQQENNHLR